MKYGYSLKIGSSTSDFSLNSVQRYDFFLNCARGRQEKIVRGSYLGILGKAKGKKKPPRSRETASEKNVGWIYYHRIKVSTFLWFGCGLQLYIRCGFAIYVGA